MIKIFPVLFLFAVLSCNRNSRETKQVKIITEDSSQMNLNFFPVTTYIQGQLLDLKNKGINPLMYTTVGNKKDSVWLKVEDVPTAIAPFLNPVIDSANLKNLFKETRFLDQTLNAYTFTYDPIGKLPVNFELQHWDVYIDPETNRVTRIYILKKEKNGTIVQLTWLSDQSCHMVWIKDNGKPLIEKDIQINWRI